MVKTDSLVNQIWNQTFGISDINQGFNVSVTTENDLILVGTTQRSIANAGVFGLMKISPSGQILWNNTFSGFIEIDISQIIQTDDKGILLIGVVKSYIDGSSVNGVQSDFFLLKTNSQGIQEWNQTVGGLREIRIFDSAVTQKNITVLAGSFSSSQGDLIAIDSFGNVLSNYTTEETRFYGFTNLIVTSDGSIIASGWIDNNPNSYLFIVKLDPNGNELWKKRYNRPGVPYPSPISILETFDGKFLILVVILQQQVVHL